MKRRQAWQYLIAVFAVFWILFAIMLIVGGLPFYIISVALSITGLLSCLIVALAWAYQNDL